MFKEKLGKEEIQVEKVFRLKAQERGKEKPLLAGLSNVYGDNTK